MEKFDIDTSKWSEIVTLRVEGRELFVRYQERKRASDFMAGELGMKIFEWAVSPDQPHDCGFDKRTADGRWWSCRIIAPLGGNAKLLILFPNPETADPEARVEFYFQGNIQMPRIDGIVKSMLNMAAQPYSAPPAALH